jgi:hypothetical protein
MWDLWWAELHWGRFFPSTLVSSAKHSTDCSTLIIWGWYIRTFSGLSNSGLSSTPPQEEEEEICTLAISLGLHPLGKYDIPTGVLNLTYL